MIQDGKPFKMANREGLPWLQAIAVRTDLTDYTAGEVDRGARSRVSLRQCWVRWVLGALLSACSNAVADSVAILICRSRSPNRYFMEMLVARFAHYHPTHASF